MAGEDPCQGGIVEQVSLGRSDAGLRLDPLRMAGDGRDLVSAARQLGEQARAHIAGSSDESDFHA